MPSIKLSDKVKSGLGLPNGTVMERGKTYHIGERDKWIFNNLVVRAWIKRGLIVEASDAPEVEEPALREDGPTVEQFVANGYIAANYPPPGYASKSTDEEILAAIEAQENPQQPQEQPSTLEDAPQGAPEVTRVNVEDVPPQEEAPAPNTANKRGRR